MSADRFHIAAKNGCVDVLSEATRKDCNKQDGDGMTPTLWAAAKGDIDTLRVIVCRGGDPGRCDYQGNTCIHWAAACGHLNAITFLVSFDCNIWAMNNNHQTPMDVAFENNRRKCVDFLDDIASKKAAANPKSVKKLKTEAMADADKRIHKYYKLQSKQHREIEKKETLKESSKKQSRKVIASTKPSNGTFSSATGGSLGTSRTDTMRGLQGENGLHDDVSDVESTPGTGRFLMVSDQRVVNAMTSLPTGGKVAEVVTEDDVTMEFSTPLHESGIEPTTFNIDPKLGTRGNREYLPWDEDVLVDDDDDDVSNSLLELFLAANGLQDYLLLFTWEDIDLEAVKLLIDEDFSKLGIPMGPRRKLMQAISKRRMSMDFSGVMMDSDL